MPYPSLPPSSPPPVIQTLSSEENTAPTFSSTFPMASGSPESHLSSRRVASDELLTNPVSVNQVNRAALLGPPVSVQISPDQALPEDLSAQETPVPEISEPVVAHQFSDNASISYSLTPNVLKGESALQDKVAEQHFAGSSLSAASPEASQTPKQEASSEPSLSAQLPADPAVSPGISQQSPQPKTAEPSSRAPVLEAQQTTAENRPGNDVAGEQKAAGNRTDDDAIGEPIEISADRQEYDDIRRVITAVGDVLLRFRQAVLQADRLQTNLPNRTVVAEGNVTLTRGAQILKGERVEYSFVQERGTLLKASGTIFLPSAQTDLSPTSPAGISPAEIQPIDQDLNANQPLTAKATGKIQRLRFEAERVDFTSKGFKATKIRITSDPFSPPELELRAEQAELVRISPVEDRVRAKRPRLVFDQGLSLPILKSAVVLSSRRSDPFALEVGIDGSDRGGVFIGRTFNLLANDKTRFSVTPEFFIERAVATRNFNLTDPDLYGANIRLNSRLTPTTSLTGFVALTSLDSSQFNDNLRASLRLRQAIGAYKLALESSYRTRLFNGSLGEQDVQNSLGAILTSPQIVLGQTGINLSYQAGIQYITANTDQEDLKNPASLGRFQGTLALKRGFYLWKGKTLPATATGGLRYTPEPVQPYLQLLTGIRGTSNAYTSGDSQQTLVSSVNLIGQTGHFSRPYLDYTGFNIGYSQVGQLGLSPFLFDRVVDFKVLSAGILQQIYGPIRAGFQASINLDTGALFNTYITLDYSRRTYGLTIRYSPTLQLGAILFRINGFNWVGNSDPFTSPDVGLVEGGVERVNELR